MCAIFGIASSSHSQERMVIDSISMHHRGPDDAGEWYTDDQRLGFSHRRLAILDLTTAAHQPMHDVTGNLTIVFNGEIYNFLELREQLKARGASFRSHSDTEVILAAYQEWGTGCVAHLNGAFAFALYDARRQIIFLARDRAGEKPLFYHHANGTLRFASELKALLADGTLPRRILPEAMDCYLAFGYVPGDRCILVGFNKLPAAHAMQFDVTTGLLKTWRYWQPPEFDEHAVQEADDTLLDELECLLQEAVRRQLVADVPVGVLLSGGVDSSLVTAMAVRVSSKVKTFSIRFPGHGKIDETEHARLVARHFGTEHTEMTAQPATADLLPQLAHQFDEPMADSSMIPTFLVSQLVRQHCTVALGGDGGDELFGGYPHYSRLLWIQSRFDLIPLPLRRVISLAAGRLLPVGLKGRNWLQGLGVNFKQDLPLIAMHFDTATRRNLMLQRGPWETSANRVLQMLVPHNSDLLQRATRMDFINYLAEDILVKVDRASMLNSLEVRAPFLDCHMMEFAFGKVPSRLKATPHDKKILLKRLTARILPPEFDRQRKQGFSIPLADWLKDGAFRKMFHEVLCDPQCLFDSHTVRNLLHGQDQGRSNGERLFSLVLFELWRREYDVSL